MFMVLYIPGGWLIFFHSISSSLEDQRDSVIRSDLITKTLVALKAGARAGGASNISNPNSKAKWYRATMCLLGIWLKFEGVFMG